MSDTEQALLCKAEKDTRAVFKNLDNRLSVVFQKKSLSSFQEELLRQYSIDCKKYFARWVQTSSKSKRATVFKAKREPAVVWECIETPIWELGEWLRNKIRNNSPQPVGDKSNGD